MGLVAASLRGRCSPPPAQAGGDWPTACDEPCPLGSPQFGQLHLIADAPTPLRWSGRASAMPVPERRLPNRASPKAKCVDNCGNQGFGWAPQAPRAASLRLPWVCDRAMAPSPNSSLPRQGTRLRALRTASGALTSEASRKVAQQGAMARSTHWAFRGRQGWNPCLAGVQRACHYALCKRDSGRHVRE